MLWMAVEPGAAGIDPQGRVEHQLCVPAVSIEGASYRLREHANLIPEALRPKAITAPVGNLPQHRGRSAKARSDKPS